MNEIEQRNYISIIITGKEVLDYEEIESNLPITPSVKAVKGENFTSPITGISHYRYESDILKYDVDYSEHEEIFDAIRRKLNDFLPFKARIASLMSKYDFVFRIFLASDLAEMYFSLPYDIIKTLAELNFCVEISTLSWGGFINDME